MSLLLFFALGGSAPVAELPGPITRRVHIPTQYRGETDAQRHARRLAQGILQPEPRVLPAKKPEQTIREPAQLDLSKYLAAVQQALADNAARQAETAGKLARARAVASMARHAAMQTRLAAEILAAQQLEAALMLQIEETDLVFVAAMLLEA